MVRTPAQKRAQAEGQRRIAEARKSLRRKAQQKQIDKVLSDLRAGGTSRSSAAAQVKKIQRGGGSGRAADPRKFALAQAALLREKLQKAREGALKKSREAALRKSREAAMQQRLDQELKARRFQRRKLAFFAEAGTPPPGRKLKGAERIAAITRRKTEEITEKLKRGEKLTLKERSLQLAAQFTIPFQEAGLAVLALPSFAKSIAKNPKNIINIPGNILTGLKETGLEITALAKVSPASAIVRVGGELLVIIGTGKGLRVTGKVTGKAATKINPFLKRVKKGKLTIKTTRGKTILRVGGTVKSIAEPLSKQAAIAGKRVTAVSAQADRLVNFIRTKRVIRKPIPGEAKFSPRIKTLLKKFDDGTIGKRDLIKLQSEVPVLERSFFADPRGRFRPSRLGLSPQKDATILDILKGDFTFKTQKPQILVFENVKVAKFPKALKDVEKALKSDKTLTKSQAKRLLDFQTAKTGMFKPVGALTREPEITLSGGEIIKIVKKRGKAVIDGRIVDIAEVKIVKAKPATRKLISKAKRGKATPKELKSLANKLKKESGFNPVISRPTVSRPRVRLPKRLPKVTRRKVRVPKRIPKRIPKVFKRIKIPAKRPTKPIREGRPPKRITKVTPTTRGRPVTRKLRPTKTTRAGRVDRIQKLTKPFLLTRKKKVKKVILKKKKNGAFDVFARPVKGKRLIKVNKKPLTKTRARDLRNFIIDTSLSARGRIKATKGIPKKGILKVPSGFARRTSVKFRRFKIRKGRRIQLSKGSVIERRGRRLDTRGEVRKITLRRRIKQITPKKKRPVNGRRITKKKNQPTIRTRVQLQALRLRNLRKARMEKVRLATLRRRQGIASTIKARRIISAI